MPYETLSVEYQPPIAIIALTRPQSGNRVDDPLLGELHDATTILRDDSITRAVVLTGTDGVFSLGWDHSYRDARLAEAGRTPRHAALSTTFQFLADYPIPLVAAINGDALSAGFELALACDVRIAVMGASLGLPETAEGLLPMGGGTQRLGRLAGRGVALEMILAAEPIDATLAFQRGIVSEVVTAETLIDRAMARAQVIGSRGPIALRLAKEAVYRGVEMPLDQALRYETDLTVLLQTTADRAEGVAAFKEKRPPNFQGD